MSYPKINIIFISEVSRSKPRLETNDILNDVLVKTGNSTSLLVLIVFDNLLKFLNTYLHRISIVQDFLNNWRRKLMFWGTRFKNT